MTVEPQLSLVTDNTAPFDQPDRVTAVRTLLEREKI